MNESLQKNQLLTEQLKQKKKELSERHEKVMQQLKDSIKRAKEIIQQINKPKEETPE